MYIQISITFIFYGLSMLYVSLALFQFDLIHSYDNDSY